MAFRSLRELQVRRQVCRNCIYLVSTADKSDPRRAEALAEYNRQLASIDAQITAITGTPPATMVGLKTAVLFPKSEIGG